MLKRIKANQMQLSNITCEYIKLTEQEEGNSMRATCDTLNEEHVDMNREKQGDKYKHWMYINKK